MFRTLLALTVAVSATVPTGSFAADVGECVCPVDADAEVLCLDAVDASDGGALGFLTEIEGDIKVTGLAGYSSASEGVGLFAGDDVVFPYGSEALLNFAPSCQARIDGNATLVVRQDGICACAALLAPKRGALLPLALLGLGAAGVGIYYLIDDSDDDPVSP
ncbi:MAG: hypothetical protein GY798_18305 [Hyphomicrobiales bacterium]|nr:hypothetical protein [Hyphomicrobiales bacterium]